MKESFLAFIWKNLYFNKSELQTTDGKYLQIQHPGVLNSDSGPDFHSAKIEIDNVTWNGNVEIHIKSSDWNLHLHHLDDAYNNVILHVVYESNEIIKRKDGSIIPQLELKDIISQNYYNNYRQLTEERKIISCDQFLPTIEDVIKINMLDRCLLERMESKAEEIKHIWVSNKKDWEETCYHVLSANFGFHINSYPFLELSRRLPLTFLKKHAYKLIQKEALFLGMAGLLNEDKAYFKYIKYPQVYMQQILNEFNFFKYKYNLVPLQPQLWKFFRTRPANFPSVRISQFARLIHKHSNLLTAVLKLTSLESIENFFKIDPFLNGNEYFFQSEENKIPDFGKASVYNVVTNSIIPFLIMYSNQNPGIIEKDEICALLELLPAEDNKITRLWLNSSIKIKTIYDSQAVMELVNNYCKPKKCLECVIGNAILNVPKKSTLVFH